RRSEAQEQRRNAFAQKIGFDAYGVANDMPDPVAQAINCMLDHMHAMDAKVEHMCKVIKELGGEDLGGEDLGMELPDLGSCEIVTGRKGEGGAESAEGSRPVESNS